MELPPLSSVIHELSREYNRYKAGEITLQECRKRLSMPKGIFYHYLKEYIALQKRAIEPQEEYTMTKVRKSFAQVDNPADKFFTTEPVTEQAPITNDIPKPPEGYKLNPLYLEVKSRRVQLVLQPSVYEAIKAEATAKGLSVNDLVNTILKQHSESERSKSE